MDEQRMCKCGWTPLVVLLAVSAAYALARYVVFGTTSPANIPVYVVNKVLAITAAACLLLGGWGQLRQREARVRFWLGAAAGLALLHVLLSLAILNRAYYPKFFAAERLSLAGELAVLLGSLTTAAGVAWLRRAPKRLSVATCLLLAGHLLAMGWSGWLHPQAWPGNMPPITLIGFVLSVVAAPCGACAGRRSKGKWLGEELYGRALAGSPVFFPIFARGRPYREGMHVPPGLSLGICRAFAIVFLPC